MRNKFDIALWKDDVFIVEKLTKDDAASLESSLLTSPILSSNATVFE